MLLFTHGTQATPWLNRQYVHKSFSKETIRDQATCFDTRRTGFRARLRENFIENTIISSNRGRVKTQVGACSQNYFEI